MQPTVPKRTKKNKCQRPATVPQPPAQASCGSSRASSVPPPPPPSPTSASPRSSTSKKPHFKPIPPKKPTAYDLFGTDSEDEEVKDVPAADTGRKLVPLSSYITRRLANGHSRQSFDCKPGTHYIDLKVYRCDEINKIQPINRWRQAIVTVKNQTSDNTDAWQHLANFIMATRKEFRKCPQTFVSNYY